MSWKREMSNGTRPPGENLEVTPGKIVKLKVKTAHTVNACGQAFWTKISREDLPRVSVGLPGGLGADSVAGGFKAPTSRTYWFDAIG
mmetsp:Transcript_54412/g.102045  ORF Transcript_54412/g.102045 Transcript_54412/m.102045 type:complete len:87 (-) Transcript_54412:566-826(-)